MPSPAVVVSVTALYLVACLALGMLPGRKATDTATGYVAGDRSLGLLLMYFITGATIFSAFAFLGAPGWAYHRGAAAFYIVGYGTLGFLPFYFLGPRAARVGRAFGFVTQAEMVAHRFGSRSLALALAAVSVAAFAPYLALQIKGAGYVLNAVTAGAVPAWLGGGLVYAVVGVYVFHSGVLGVGWTNTFQGIFMMVLAWILGLYLPMRLYGGVGELFQRIATERPELLRAPGLTADGLPWTWGEYSAAILVSIAGFSVWPHLFMKAFSASDERTIRRTVVMYPTFQLFLVPLLILGFCGVFFATAPAEPDQILPHLLMNIELPSVVVGLFCAGALAASMSSGDAMAHAAASIAVRDGWVSGLGRHLAPGQQRRAIRGCLVAMLVLSYALAVGYRGSLVLLLLNAYGAVVQFFPAVVATLYWRRATARGVLTGLLAGTAITVLLLARPDWQPVRLHAGLYGLVANVALLVGLSLKRGAPAPAGEEFLRVAAGGRAQSPP